MHLIFKNNGSFHEFMLMCGVKNSERSPYMYDILVNLMLILSVFSIIVIAIQPTKTSSSSNAFMGASELFTQQKSRGFEAFLSKVTVVSLILFFILSLLLLNIS